MPLFSTAEVNFSRALLTASSCTSILGISSATSSRTLCIMYLFPLISFIASSVSDKSFFNASSSVLEPLLMIPSIIFASSSSCTSTFSRGLNLSAIRVISALSSFSTCSAERKMVSASSVIPKSALSAASEIFSEVTCIAASTISFVCSAK